MQDIFFPCYCMLSKGWFRLTVYNFVVEVLWLSVLRFELRGSDMTS